MKNPIRILPILPALLVGTLLSAGCDDYRQTKQAPESPAPPASAESSDKSVPPPQQPELGRSWPDGPAPSTLAWQVVCTLPLVLCWYLLHGLRRDTDDAEISRLLVEEIVAERPLILPSPAQRPAMDPGSWPPPRPPVIRKIER